jgi:hypothetical protein
MAQRRREVAMRRISMVSSAIAAFLLLAKKEIKEIGKW